MQIDNGLKSRKLWLNVFTMSLVFGGGLLCICHPVFIPAYATYCGTLVSLYALYFGSNVAEKHVLGKQELAHKELDQKKLAPDEQNG